MPDMAAWAKNSGFLQETLQTILAAWPMSSYIRGNSGEGKNR